MTCRIRRVLSGVHRSRCRSQAGRGARHPTPGSAGRRVQPRHRRILVDADARIAARTTRLGGADAVFVKRVKSVLLATAR